MDDECWFFVFSVIRLIEAYRIIILIMEPYHGATDLAAQCSPIVAEESGANSTLIVRHFYWLTIRVQMINWFRSIDRLNVRQSHLRRRKRLYCIRNCHYYYIITALYTGEKNTKTTNNQLITAIFNSTFTHTAQHSAVECSTVECSTVEYNTNGDIEKE